MMYKTFYDLIILAAFF